MKKKLVWFDARDLKNEEQVLPLVFNLRFEYLLVKYDRYPEIKPPRKMKLIVEVDQSAQLEAISKEAIIFSGNVDLLQQAKAAGFKTALHQRISDEESMNTAWKAGSRSEYLVAELTAETNIPLELLIARLQGSDTVLLKMLGTVQDADIAFGVMEVGSDGVVLKSEDFNEIMGVDRFMCREEQGKVELLKGRVIEVQHIGMGYRACIDTTNLMEKNEGMIVGSTSNGGLLVSSETHYLPFMELRPFRVNAGAVHSYVWAPEGMTAYMTELKAGSKVLCVDTNGNTREVSVGRVKTEMRPLLKIEVEADGKRINAIVQDDWHIRIFGGEGEPRNASTIKAGEELLVYTCTSGRHVGVKIDETIEEK